MDQPINAGPGLKPDRDTWRKVTEESLSGSIQNFLACHTVEECATLVADILNSKLEERG